MKIKLIAMILSFTVLGGAGTATYNILHSTSQKTVTNNQVDTANKKEKSITKSDGQATTSESKIETLSEVNKTNANENVKTEEKIVSTSNQNNNANAPNTTKTTEKVVQAPVEGESKVQESIVQTSVEQKTPVVENKTSVVEEATPVVEAPKAEVASTQFMAQVESMIFTKVNEERAKAGVPVLTYNTTMEKYARIKSQDMGDRGYFSHNDPEGNLITVRMKNDGVTYRAWGENIAYIGGVSDPTDLANQFMTNWMNSQGHRENILSTNFSGIGVGVYKIGNKVYATQEFYR